MPIYCASVVLEFWLPGSCIGWLGPCLHAAVCGRGLPCCMPGHSGCVLGCPFNTWITSCAFSAVPCLQGCTACLPNTLGPLRAARLLCCACRAAAVRVLLRAVWACTAMTGGCCSAASALHHLLCVGAAVAQGARAPIAWIDWIAACCVLLVFARRAE
jgi:hypothetical protein